MCTIFENVKVKLYVHSYGFIKICCSYYIYTITFITYFTVAHILALLYLDVVCLPELLRCYPGVKREENLKFQATRTTGIIGSKKLKSAFARNE